MNERIKQLAEQANVLHADFFDNELEVEKFAQLIIQECTDLFADQQNMIVNQNKPFAYRTVRALAQHDRDTVKKIKQHFGVEE